MEVATLKRRGGDNRAAGQKARPAWVASNIGKKHLGGVIAGFADQWERQNDSHRTALGLGPVLTIDWLTKAKKVQVSCQACRCCGSVIEFWDGHTPSLCAALCALRCEKFFAVGPDWTLTCAAAKTIRSRPEIAAAMNDGWRDMLNDRRAQDLRIAHEQMQLESSGAEQREIGVPATPISLPHEAAETPATAVRRVVPASEAPPLYAHHPDRERIEKLPVLSSAEFTGWEPVDIIDLADAGEKLLDTHGSWILAVEPLVRELECVMRGQPSSVDHQSYDLAVRYLGELRRQLCGLIGILDAGDLPTDFAIGVRLRQLETGL